MSPNETPSKNERIAALSQSLSLKMGLPIPDVIIFALESALSFPTPENYDPEKTPMILLEQAEKLCDERGGFTLDELLISAYGNQMILTMHSLKILAAKILRAAGYQRKQVRRGGARPLLWFKPFVLDEGLAEVFSEQKEETCPT